MRPSVRRAILRGAGRPALALAAAWLMSACSSGPPKPQPAPLEPVVPLVEARQVWTQSIGPVDALLTPVVRDGQLALANAAGEVSVLDGETGRLRWRAAAGAPMAAGVGFDGRRVALVTRASELVVLTEAGVAWRQRLPARVFTAPLVAGERVFVLAGDRSVTAFDARNGARLWQQTSRGTEPLVLQERGVLTAVGNTLVAGIGGRMVGLNPDNGNIRWDVAVGRTRGATEVERLVDLVGRTGRDGDVLCARAFQVAIGCVDAAAGRLLWTQSADGATGVQADAERVYGTEANGRVIALARRDGARQWVNERLLHRGLSAPLAIGRSLAIGDAQGYVHLLARADGAMLNRLSTDGSAIVEGPLAVGNTLIAVTRNGGVFAWRPQ
ncbi:Outer membrane protein assembly factor BamB [Tepidimonas alkaliphilus]|uniref:Outer membrane protein assembly factor BamB n=1 Tax=Tepidimonas alkaliphilus TaxID=2588942 RepID=A0A554WDA9_9BURK|nr:outer membrane protein assembly factor BamB [Tepidimonas alkaliphilus]TSE21570.1 Outer membrane protein assembly factor BamB [Tepidimonas alkaliphilus]